MNNDQNDAKQMAINLNSLNFTVENEQESQPFNVEAQFIKELSEDNPSEEDKRIIGKEIYQDYISARNENLRNLVGKVVDIVFYDRHNHKIVKAASLHELLDGIITIENFPQNEE